MKCKSEKVVKILFVFALVVACFSIDNVMALDESDYTSYCKYQLVNKSDFVSVCDLDKVYIYIGSESGNVEDLKAQGSSACFRVGDRSEFYKDEVSLLVLGGTNKNYCPTKVEYCPVGSVSVYGELKFDGSLCSESTAKFELVDVKGFKTYIPTPDENGNYRSCKTGSQEIEKLETEISRLSKSIERNNIDKSTFEQLKKDKTNLSNNITTAIKANYCEQEETENLANEYNDFNTSFKKIVDGSILSSGDKSELKGSSDSDMAAINIALNSVINSRTSNSADISLPGEATETTCEGLIDADLMTIINLVLNIVRIAAPIVLLVLITIDLGQVVISNDKEAMPKAISRSIKRAIAAVVIFFIPYIVNLIIDWLNQYANANAVNCIK